MIELKSGFSNPEPSQEVLNNLLRNYQKGQYQVAEQLATDLVNNFPSHPFGWKVLGVLFRKTGRLSQAIEANRKLVSITPQDAGAHNNMGNALLADGRPDEAKLSFQKAITLQPSYSEAYSNLGNTFQELGILEEAENNHKQAISLKPDFVSAHFNLGVVLQLLNRLEEAEGCYRKALELAPDYAKAHNNLGNVLQAQGKLNEAEASFEKAIALKPEYAEAYSNRGNTLLELAIEILGRAEKNYRQAVGFAPDFAEAHSNLSLTLEKLGKTEEADQVYQRAISLSPDLAGAHSNRGLTFTKTGNQDSSTPSRRRMLAVKPVNVETEYNAGVALYGQGQYQEAIEKFRVSNHDNKDTYLLKCFFRLNDQSKFYDHLEYLSDRGTVNAAIGSLTSRAELKYGIKKTNRFADEPLDYVVNIDLTRNYDFDSNFVKISKKVLSDNSVSYKSQAHLTNGHQTAGNLFENNQSLFQKIEEILRVEIEKYRDRFNEDDEGFLKKWPEKYRLYGWLLSMKSGGKLAPHIHESGWLSGVIYINVPPKSTPDSGNLVVCIDEEKLQSEEGLNPHKTLDVVTGNLVLFPASLMHYTIPFESGEGRISLAFDVVPD